MENEPIKITHEDLNSAENIRREQQLQEAKVVSQVRAVGSAPASLGRGAAVKEAAYLAAAGLGGGLLSYLLNKVSDPVFADSDVSVQNVAFTVMMAVSIGLFVSMVDAVSTRSGAKVARAAGMAAGIALAAGLVFGFIANSYYSGAVEGIYARVTDMYLNDEFASEADALAWLSSQMHLPRGIAWLLVGVSAGVTAGLVSKSMKRLALTAIGGAIGGFLGGFVFDSLPGETAAQLVGMGLTGLLVGLGMAAIEQATKSRWIEIVRGGLAGKQFILYKQDLVIGSSPQADITLIKDSQIPPLAIRITSSGAVTTAVAMAQASIRIDGIESNMWQLHDGSHIEIGSTSLIFREKSGQAVPTQKIDRTL